MAPYISLKSIVKLESFLARDEPGHLIRKAIINRSKELHHEEMEAGKTYDKYAQELEDYGAPMEIVRAYRKMAKDEFSHAYVFQMLVGHL